MVHRVSRRQVLAAAGALTLVLAGCRGGEPSEEGDENLSGNRAGAMPDYGVGDQFKATEALTFSILYNNHPNYPNKKDWLFWSELKKRTNVTLETVEVPLSDYEQKRSLLIGSGDAPLIIPKTYPAQEDPFVSSGAILPVSEYTDLMPHFTDKVSKWNLEADLNTRRQADGKFYLLPGLHEKPWVDYSLAIRVDVLEELGLEIPKTWDDLRTVMQEMKKAHPGTYPLSDRFNQAPPSRPGGCLLKILGEAYGAPGGWAYNAATWDYEAKQYAFTGAMEQYRQMLEYLNTLFKEGLIDPESFSQSDDQARQKLASGKSFVISSNAQTIVNDYRPDLAKTIPDARIVKIPVPIGPMGEVITWPSASRLENGIMISSKARESKNFVAMMQFIDWLWYSDEGQEFARWGVEGVTYTKDASGKRKLARDVDVVGLNPGAPKHLQRDFGFYNGVFAYGGTTELVQSFFSEEEREFQAVMNARRPLEVPPPYPFTAEEREQATLWETPLTDHVIQNTLKFILGERSLGEWDEYVSELKGLNMDSYMDLVRKAYERFQSQHG